VIIDIDILPNYSIHNFIYVKKIAYFSDNLLNESHIYVFSYSHIIAKIVSKWVLCVRVCECLNVRNSINIAYIYIYI